MKKIILFFVIVLLLAVGTLTYLGLVPQLSKYVVKPKDLGITADPTFITTYEPKIHFRNELPSGVVPTGREGVFSGTTKVDEKLTSVEASSILSEWKHRSPSLPIRDVQVRFNPDGSSEISGILEIDTAVSLAKNLGYSDEDIDTAKSYAKYVSGDLPFYVKGTAGVKNNQVTISPSSFELGRVGIPSSITGPAAKAVEDVIERRLRQVGGIDIQSIEIDSGSLHFAGTIPSAIK